MRPSQLGKKLIGILKLRWETNSDGESGFLRHGLIPCGYQTSTEPDKSPHFWVFKGQVKFDGQLTGEELINICGPVYSKGSYVYKMNSYDPDAEISEQEAQEYILGAEAYMEKENKIRDIVGDDGMDVLGI